MRRACFFVFACLSLWGLRALPAEAHAELLESDPGTAETVATTIDEISITLISFEASEPVTVSVTDAAGNEYATGEPEISVLNSVVTQPIESIGAGTYTVSWTAMSSDGDGLATGAFDFTADDVGSGIFVYVLWALVLAVFGFVFLRPGARRRKDDGGDNGGRANKELV